MGLLQRCRRAMTADVTALGHLCDDGRTAKARTLLMTAACPGNSGSAAPPQTAVETGVEPRWAR